MGEKKILMDDTMKRQFDEDSLGPAYMGRQDALRLGLPLRGPRYK